MADQYWGAWLDKLGQADLRRLRDEIDTRLGAHGGENYADLTDAFAVGMFCTLLCKIVN